MSVVSTQVQPFPKIALAEDALTYMGLGSTGNSGRMSTLYLQNLKFFYARGDLTADFPERRSRNRISKPRIRLRRPAFAGQLRRGMGYGATGDADDTDGDRVPQRMTDHRTELVKIP